MRTETVVLLLVGSPASIPVPVLSRYYMNLSKYFLNEHMNILYNYGLAVLYHAMILVETSDNS